MVLFLAKKRGYKVSILNSTTISKRLIVAFPKSKQMHQTAPSQSADNWARLARQTRMFGEALLCPEQISAGALRPNEGGGQSKTALGGAARGY